MSLGNRVLVGTCLLSLLPGALFAQGKLSRVRNEVRAPEPERRYPYSDKGSKNRNNRRDNDDDDDDESFLTIIIAGIFDSDDDDDEEEDRRRRERQRRLRQNAERGRQFAREHVSYDTQVDQNSWPPEPRYERSMGSDFEPMPPPPTTNISYETAQWRGERDISFAHYPYADGHDGYMIQYPSEARSEGLGAFVRFAYGSDFDGLDQWTGKFLWESSSRLSFDGDWTFYREDLGEREYDELHIGDANIMYRFGESSFSQFYMGIGFNWLHDSFSTDLGLNFTMKFNCYPIQPLVLSTEFDYGTLGSATQLHAAATAGLIWNHWEVFAGFDHRQIDDIALNGPTFGGRYWW